MSRLRRSAGDHAALTEAIDILARDGAAPATIEPLSDLSIAESRLLRARWSSLPRPVRRDLVSHMATLGEEDLRFNFERALIVALSDEDPDVRVAAIRALWEAESTALLDELLKRLTDEPSARVRLALVEALGRFAQMGSEGRLDEEHRQNTERTLVDVAQGDTDDGIRLEAMASAAYLRPQSVEAQILQAYDHGHDEAQEVALRAMGRFGGHQWASRVIDALRSGDGDQRTEAARSAPYVEERRVIPFLYEAAEEDESPDLQVAALGALGEIGGREVRSFLEEVRDSTDGMVSQAAEDALATAALLDDVTSGAFS